MTLSKKPSFQNWRIHSNQIIFKFSNIAFNSGKKPAMIYAVLAWNKLHLNSVQGFHHFIRECRVPYMYFLEILAAVRIYVTSGAGAKFNSIANILGGWTTYLSQPNQFVIGISHSQTRSNTLLEQSRNAANHLSFDNLSYTGVLFIRNRVFS